MDIYLLCLTEGLTEITSYRSLLLLNYRPSKGLWALVDQGDSYNHRPVTDSAT